LKKREHRVIVWFGTRRSSNSSVNHPGGRLIVKCESSWRTTDSKGSLTLDYQASSMILLTLFSMVLQDATRFTISCPPGRFTLYYQSSSRMIHTLFSVVLQDDSHFTISCPPGRFTLAISMRLPHVKTLKFRTYVRHTYRYITLPRYDVAYL
jgi:hypothetical protein